MMKFVNTLMLHILESWIFRFVSDRNYLIMRFWVRRKSIPDLDNPKTYNEKVQWLKLHDRKLLYTQLTDKVKVREYISKHIGEEYNVPLLGVWEDARDIGFSKLPNELVLKCNHDSGSIIKIQDKTLVNEEKIIKHFNKCLKKNYYYKTREWPYKNIVPKVIAEEYLNDGTTIGLRDYKVFCFHGKVKFIRVQYMGKDSVIKSEFDTNWKIIDKTMNFLPDGTVVEKPKNLNKIIELAEILAKDMVHLRVDFYLVNDRIFIGELTLYHGSGFNWFRYRDVEIKMGSYINLKRIKESR